MAGPKVAVIGAGNVGCALAAHLTLRGVSRSSRCAVARAVQFSVHVLEIELQPAADRTEASAGDFFIYREGSGPATARVMEAVDAERMALATRLAVTTLSLVDALAWAGYSTLEAAAGGRVCTKRSRRGEPIRRVRGLSTPTMEALVVLAGVLNGVNYRGDALTLERMGLIGMDPDDIGRYARTGEL